MTEKYVLKSKISEHIQTLILSGILFTLVSMAYGLGKLVTGFEMKIDDHEKRITKLEK